MVLRPPAGYIIIESLDDFMDRRPDPAEVPEELIAHIKRAENWRLLREQWDRKYPGNPLTVPFVAFETSGDGTIPDFDRFSVVDFGQTIRLGDYEAASDAVLRDFDRACRQRPVTAGTLRT